LSKQAREELKFANTVIRELLKPKYYAISYPFLVPVDPIKLNIPTYFEVIKHPMDLGTVRKKLEAGAHVNGADFESDMRLIFRNCATFNAPGSEVFEMGRKLELLFEQLWSSKPAPAPAPAPPPPKVKPPPKPPARVVEKPVVAQEEESSSSSEEEGRRIVFWSRRAKYHFINFIRRGHRQTSRTYFQNHA
jgi:bromodomain-containing factor 1